MVGAEFDDLIIMDPDPGLSLTTINQSIFEIKYSKQDFEWNCTSCTGTQFNVLTKSVQHCQRTHKVVPELVCSKCLNVRNKDGNIRSISIHFAKCQTKVPVQTMKKFSCSIEQCGQSYDSKIELGQHVRHARQEVAMKKRLQERVKSGVSRSNTKWTPRSDQILTNVIMERASETPRKLGRMLQGKSSLKTLAPINIKITVIPLTERASPFCQCLML
jgi:hypothetical protein